MINNGSFVYQGSSASAAAPLGCLW